MATDESVIFQGVLELGREATAASLSSRDWKSRLFVLRRDPLTHTSTLYMYRDTKKKWQRQTAKAILHLHPTFHVSLAHTSGYKYPLQLTVADHPPHYLAAETSHLMNIWLNHLQMQRILVPDKFGTYVFPVQSQDGTHTSIIGVHGDCLLAITTDSEILCALAATRQVVGVWPFNCLRRYWCGEGMFGFEAGKRSPRGEGTFTFATQQDEELYAMLKKYIDKAKQASLRRGGSRYGGVETRPQLPLPQDSARAGFSSEMANGGDEYAQIPLQDVLVGQPSSHSPLQRTNSLPPTHTDVSATNPMYGGLKRAQTAKPKRIQEWVEQTEAAISREREVGGAGGGAKTPPPPVIPRGLSRGSPTLAEEDMYSHTRHIMPAPFQRHATVHAIVEESMYNTLVHKKCRPALKRRATDGGAGQGLYSIAYQPSATQGRRLVVARPGDEYGTLNREAVDSPSEKTPPKTTPTAVEEGVDGPEERTSVSSAPKDLVLPGRGFEDSMTENLMYNTRQDVLSGTQTQLVGREEEGKEGEKKDEDIDVKEEERENGERDEVEGVREESSGSSLPGGVAEGVANKQANGEREDGSPSDEGERGGGREIQRDSKGYSKVDKSRKTREDSEDPPPLPPRLYEGAEEEEIAPPVSLATPPSPVAVPDSPAAVSDV